MAGRPRWTRIAQSAASCRFQGASLPKLPGSEAEMFRFGECALDSSRFLLLVAMPLLVVAMPLLLVAYSWNQLPLQSYLFHLALAVDPHSRAVPFLRGCVHCSKAFARVAPGRRGCSSRACIWLSFFVCNRR